MGKEAGAELDTIRDTSARIPLGRSLQSYRGRGAVVVESPKSVQLTRGYRHMDAQRHVRSGRKVRLLEMKR